MTVFIQQLSDPSCLQDAEIKFYLKLNKNEESKCLFDSWILQGQIMLQILRGQAVWQDTEGSH